MAKHALGNATLLRRRSQAEGAPSVYSLHPVLALQTTAGNTAVSRLIAAQATKPSSAVVPVTVSRVDTRRGTGTLSNAQIRDIGHQIRPASAPTRPGGATRAWDGDVGPLPTRILNRLLLASEMLVAMNAYLDQQMPGIRDEADTTVTPRVTVTDMSGAGRAAKRVVDSTFSSWAASSTALTTAQETQRADFDFDPGVELIDRSDPAQFVTDTADLADWIAQTASASSAAQRRHGFDKDRGGPGGREAAWLASNVLAPFEAARRADLDLFDRFGFLDTTRRRISIVPTLTHGGTTTPGRGGAPSSALRRQQWANWRFLTHEYIHTLEHPAFEEARGDNRVLFEGFCELFALQVLARWMRIARADSDPSLRGEIEGRNGAGRLWPGFRPSWVGTASAGEYAEYVQHARAIRRRIGAGGENAIRAAFFQGHLELIGMERSGAMRATALRLTDVVTVPAGIADRAALARAARVGEREIARANPSLRGTGAAVAAGSRVSLRGCREHEVVEAPPTSDLPAGPARIETPAQIARQYGITEAVLRGANPAVSWAGLHAGDHVLIPRR